MTLAREEIPPNPPGLGIWSVYFWFHYVDIFMNRIFLTFVLIYLLFSAFLEPKHCFYSMQKFVYGVMDNYFYI